MTTGEWGQFLWMDEMSSLVFCRIRGFLPRIPLLLGGIEILKYLGVIVGIKHGSELIQLVGAIRDGGENGLTVGEAYIPPHLG